jgi:N-methylhydantoinase B
MQAGAPEGFYHFGPERDAYERTWTRPNYDALTELLASLPVHWRFFIKARLFEAMEALDSDERAGDGSEVRALYQSIAREYPELAGLRVS